MLFLIACQPPSEVGTIDEVEALLNVFQSWLPESHHSSPFAVAAGELIDREGIVNAGRVRSPEDAVVMRLTLSPGTHRLQVHARMSSVDDAAGVVEVTLGEANIGRMEFPSGEAHTATLDVSVSDWTDERLMVSLVNPVGDHESGFKRELRIERIEMNPQSAAGVEERTGYLKKRLHRSNVLLVSIDTLRADHVGVYGYSRETSPTIDRLARQGVVFEQAFSTSHWTAPSHASLLTGLYPGDHGVQTFPVPERMGAGIQTIGERFSEAGYDTAWFAGGGYVSADLGMATGMTIIDEGGALAEQRFERVADWLRERESGQPFFAFVHTYQVHDPYDPPAYYNRWAPDAADWLRTSFEQTFYAGRSIKSGELEQLIGLYDGEIRYTDAALGDLFVAMGEMGLFSETLVVVTSDHGEEFLEYGHIGHSSLREANVHVPWIMSHPAMVGAVESGVEEVVSTVDVLPTLLELVGIEASGTISGQSRLGLIAGKEQPSAYAFAQSEMRYSNEIVVDHDAILFRAGEHVLLYERDAQLPGREVAIQDATSRYIEALDEWAGGLSLVALPEVAPMSEKRREELEALGYLDPD